MAKTDPQCTAAVNALLCSCFDNLGTNCEREACAARLRRDEQEAKRLEHDAAELKGWADVMARREAK